MKPTPRAVAALVIGLTLCFLVAMDLPAQSEGDPARLYGRVVTPDGSVYQGFIRWAGNEAGLYDILHASKEIPERNRRDAERLGWEPERSERRIEIFGIGITLPGDEPSVGRSASTGVRFGQISTIEVTGSNEARLLLRSGEEVELRGGGDLGRSVDEIIVEDPRRGEVELEWEDVVLIDFLPAPEGVASAWGDRLYGTLETRDGERFTGYVAWDMDELFTSEVLDGEENDVDREIPFGRIRQLERVSSGATRVHLLDGGEMVLRGSNDVNDDNRDIMVADPGLGEVRVEWDGFRSLELQRPPAGLPDSGFDGGRLYGSIEARGGERHTGWIRWDNDEEYGWEILDGELNDDVELDVEFGQIRSIERVAFESSLVTLRDGRTFELTGSNDVDEDNKGIYVERDDGTLILVPWDRFERVVFRD